MLKHWKQEKGSAATYQALCGALTHRLVKRQDLAEQFCYINGKYLIFYIYDGNVHCSGLMFSVVDSGPSGLLFSELNNS